MANLTDMTRLEASRTGRARCQICKKKIAKGEWRYGEDEYSMHFDGSYLRWYHLDCAIDRKPTGVSRELASAFDEMARLDWGTRYSQAVINRCVRKREAIVKKPLWLAPVDDGRAYVVCLLEDDRYGVVSPIGEKWKLQVAQSLDDALALLPEPAFVRAAPDLLGR